MIKDNSCTTFRSFFGFANNRFKIIPTWISKHTKYEKRIDISTGAVTRAIPPTLGPPQPARGGHRLACLYPPPTSELECSNNNRGTDGEIMVTRPRRRGYRRRGTLSTITDKLIRALPGPGPPCSGPPGAALPMVTSQMLWVCYYTTATALVTGHLLGNAKHCRKLTLVLTSYPQLFVSRQFL